jgi:hypothetical protein
MTELIWEGERAPFAKAFVAAQRATEAIKKASTNPAFKSRYADLAAVVEAVVPALNAAGIGVIQASDFDGDMVNVTTMLLHESGASVTSNMRLRPSKSDAQGIGSATTYGRRYNLLAMTGAAPEDDDGAAASGPREPKPQQEAPKPPTLAERADRFTTSLKALTTTAEREKAYKLASKLLADLDASDPERLAEIEALYLELQFDGERAAA